MLGLGRLGSTGWAMGDQEFVPYEAGMLSKTVEPCQ